MNPFHHFKPEVTAVSRPSRLCCALLALGLVVVSVTLATTGSPGHRASGVRRPGLLPAVDAIASPVTVSTGEDPTTEVVSWARPPAPTTSASVTVTPAGDPAAAPVATVPVDPSGDAVALPVLASGSYSATVILVSAAGTTELGPSSPFAVGSGSDSASGRVSVAAAAALPCEGASYGVGRVSVDGYAGYQGSYCLPPAFTSGTGAFCIDHGLDYPFGAYGWASSVAGATVPLDNQYGRAADPADLARLAWIVGTSGSTADPAQAVAIGIITHAVMGDYPGLAVADLDPVNLQVVGGAPATISADVGALWAASATQAGPYQMQIQAGTGPYAVGTATTGHIILTGAGGGPEAGVPVTLAASTGATITPTTGVTGTDGTMAFSWTPTSTAVSLQATTTTPLPGAQLTVWRPTTTSVPVQRVVTAGPGVTPTATTTVTATAPATLTLVKVSADPTWVPVGAGFTFDVDQPTGPGGAWQTVASRQTASDGTMAPVTGLAAGPYRVTETAHPPAFQAGGPWTGQLTSGQIATFTMTDAVTPVPVTVTKTGDDQSVLPIGAGVTFAVAFDADGSGHYATALADVSTEASGSTPPTALAPGRYRITEKVPPAGYTPAAPVDVTVPVPTGSSPTPLVVPVQDTAIPGQVSVSKVDSATGAALSGAVVTVTPAGGSGGSVADTVTSSATGPVVAGPLLPGSYTVTETHAPAGYLLSPPATQTVSVGPGQTAAVTFRDQRIPTPVASSVTPAAPAPAIPTTVASTVLAFTGMSLWPSIAVGTATVLAGVVLVLGARGRKSRRRR